MKLNKIYILPFFWLWIVSIVRSDDPIDDGYKELCNPNKGYRCDCPLESNGEDENKLYHLMDCSNRDLTNMSQFIQFVQQIQFVNFKNNKIKSILQNTFVKGENVIQIDISYNNIDFTHHSVFQPLHKLNKLILSHNSIWNLDSNLFDGLNYLEVLDLSYNSIQSWDESSFIPCKNLKELDLRYNAIGLLGLGHKAFDHLPRLEKLNLENTGLSELPFNIFAYNYNLKYLYLSGNEFKKVPNSALQSATSLRFLDMSATYLQYIQYEDFVGLKSLTEIRLERIHTLQRIGMNAFQDLENLQSFICRNNYQLNEIDSKAFTNNITGEPLRLISVILRHNSLQTLSSEMLLWKSLHQIDFEGNPWNCDCNLKWIAEYDIRLKMGTKCNKPHRVSGQPIKSLSVNDFVCQSLFVGDSFLIAILIFMIIATLSLTGIAFIFIRNSWCSSGCYIPFRKNKVHYLKVVANKERVDLEWDHSAEP
jgi:Leucine-rich repeat (LRR) protein